MKLEHRVTLESPRTDGPGRSFKDAVQISGLAAGVPLQEKLATPPHTGVKGREELGTGS